METTRAVYTSQDEVWSDEYGKEMGSNARVWREYVEVATLHDDKNIERWNTSTDVILIFVSIPIPYDSISYDKIPGRRRLYSQLS